MVITIHDITANYHSKYLFLFTLHVTICNYLIIMQICCPEVKRSWTLGGGGGGGGGGERSHLKSDTLEETCELQAA